MKLILFTVSTFVASVNMVAADVSLAGYGRFGLYYNEGSAENNSRLDQRFRLDITGATETDTGIKLKGVIRFQTDDGSRGSSNVAQRSAALFVVSSGNFQLNIGNASGLVDSDDVIDWYGYGVGVSKFAEQSTNFIIPITEFSVSNDEARIPPTVRATYRFEKFIFSATYTDDAVLAKNSSGDELGGTSESWEIGVGYKYDGLSFGGLHGASETPSGKTNNYWAVTFNGTVGELGFSLLVADSDMQDDTAYGASAKFHVNPVTELRIVYSDNGMDNYMKSGAKVKQGGLYAIGFRHGLGGGITMAGGIGHSTLGNTVGDLGVIFNF